jgi:hypothetical protein
MKVFVLKDCIKRNRDVLVAKSVVEIDEKDDQKLLDLGLVEEYDAEIHNFLNISVDTNELKAIIKEQEAEIIELETMLEEAINLPKGKKPKGYDDESEVE